MAVIGLAVTAVLVVFSHSVYTRDERRLLTLRTRDAESLLTAALPGIQTPLASAAALADATRGNARKFRAFIGPYVGRRQAQPFVSVSLWRLRDIAAGPKTVVGLRPELSIADATGFLPGSAHTARLSLVSLLGAPQPRLGYSFSNSSTSGRYVAYGESALPVDRIAPATPGSPFSDLNFAIYLGRSQQPRDLVVTTVPRLPLAGPRSMVIVPFGNSVFTLIASSRHPLSGTLSQRLPLIIALAGALLTLLAAALTSRLVQRRRHAEHLAGELERVAAENRRLYAEQREIAVALQHALLPDSLPEVAGLEADARYLAGEAGMEIGGDWYDVIPVGEHAVLIAVGDVSGRGLQAASTMASLRFAIHAYAVQEDDPGMILSKLSQLLSIAESRQLATVLCAVLDLEGRRITLASAGHLPPLLIAGGRGEYLTGEVGVPIGVEKNAHYESTTISVPSSATLLAYTDGLVERRNEHLDQGLERLQRVATANHAELPELLNRVLSALRTPPARDDTAIIGVRWTTEERLDDASSGRRDARVR